MALSDTQKKGLKLAVVAFVAALAGVFAESTGLLGQIADLILSLVGQ